MVTIVTFYYDAGSKYEEVFIITVDESCPVWPRLREDYETDEDKTERITDDDGTVHITKYLRKQR